MSTLPLATCLYGRPYVAVVNPRQTSVNFTITEGPFVAHQSWEDPSRSVDIKELQVDGIAALTFKQTDAEKPKVVKMAMIKGTLLYPSSNQHHQKSTKRDKMALSQYQLSKKARAMGIYVQHIHDGSTIPTVNKQISPKDIITNVSQNRGQSEDNATSPDGSGPLENGHGATKKHDGVILPKLPTIKHPYETDIPPVVHPREPANSCELPVCTATITPHSKPSLTSNRTSKTQRTTENSTDEKLETRQSDGDKAVVKSFRLIVSPKSYRDFQNRPEKYYNQRFPHVVLDGSKKDTDTKLLSPSGFGAGFGFPQLTRSRTDLTAIEKEISRTAQIIKPIQSASVSGWLHGFHCQPKAIHTRRKVRLTNLDTTSKGFRWSW